MRERKSPERGTSTLSAIAVCSLQCPTTVSSLRTGR